MKKRIVVLVVAFLVCIVFPGNSAKADWDWGYEHVSPAGIAGYTFYSPQGTLIWNTTIFTHLCGGDVQVKLLEGTRGLTDAFFYSPSRTITVYLQEVDGSTSMTARRYTANFTGGSSYNHPGSWSNPYINSSTIEADGDVELRLAIFIDSLAGDTSTAVPPSIFTYSFGVRYD